MAKRRHSNWKTIDEELGLEFALDKFRGRKAPKKKDVLLHLFYFLKCEGRGQTSVDDVAKLVVQSIKARWQGSCVTLATDQTLHKKVKELYSLFR